MNEYHESVLLKEAVDYLQVEKGKRYIDATLGGGGHAVEIVKQGGKVLGIDVDEEAVGYVGDRIKNQESGIKRDKDLVLYRGNFRELGKIAKESGFEKVAGILFDLWVSSWQFDTGGRGFSFQKDAPLDMRMDLGLSVSAGDLVNGLTRNELSELFWKLGEEKFAKKIALAIDNYRKNKKIESTRELAELVERTVRRSEKIHPATRIFQALRIAVNGELESLREALPQAVELLEPGGRVVVISFHSLEDRIVKNSFSGFAESGFGRIITRKPVEVSELEVEKNRRARSAKLRVFEKK